MRFTGGWVKIHRKILSPDWMLKIDGSARNLFMHIVMMANYKPSEFYKNGCVQKVDIGQLLTSMAELEKMTDLNYRTISKRLERLEEIGSILVKRSNAGTTITVCNYNTYQDVYDEKCNAEYNTEYNAEYKTEYKTEYKHNEEVIKELPKEVKEIKEGGYARAHEPPSELDLSERVWEQYEYSFVNTYGIPPFKNDAALKLCKQLIKHVGFENAMGVAQYYPMDRRKFYIDRGHVPEFMVKDHAKLVLLFHEFKKRNNCI